MTGDRAERFLLFLDLETTGLSAEEHEILEVAVVLTDFDLKEVDRYEAKVLPMHIETASPKALEINGYNPDTWAKEGVTLDSAVMHIGKMLPYKVRAFPAGHNIIKFDLPFMRKAFNDVGQFCPISYPAVDTYPMAVAYMVRNKIPASDLPNLKLTTLSDYFGIPHQGAHTALADVLANIEVYRRLTEKWS